MTSASRMTFAFSRDGAIPGSELWKRLTANRVPAQRGGHGGRRRRGRAHPAGADQGRRRTARAVPAGVLRRHLDRGHRPLPGVRDPDLAALAARATSSTSGSWNNGAKYKWMNPIAVAEIVIVSIYLMMPSTPAANPFRDEFEWKFVNYAPIVTLGALLLLTIWWNVSAKKWFTGPEAHHRRGRRRGLRRPDPVLPVDVARRPGPPRLPGGAVLARRRAARRPDQPQPPGHHRRRGPSSTWWSAARRATPACSGSTGTPSTSTPGAAAEAGVGAAVVEYRPDLAHAGDRLPARAARSATPTSPTPA